MEVGIAFVGRHSLAGNQGYAKTAHKSFYMEFDSSLSNPEEHGWVVDVFKFINNEDKLTNTGGKPIGYLSALDSDVYETWQQKCGLPGTSGDWGSRNWECHYGVIEAGNPWSKNKQISAGDVEWLWVNNNGFATKYLK